jgi:hypothetical protein
MAAYRPFGRSPQLEVFTAERTWDSYDLPGSPKALPWPKTPRVVVPDNAGVYTSRVIRRGRHRLTATGVSLYFLLAYGPELILAEPVLR